jgi:hypothetical protein
MRIKDLFIKRKEEPISEPSLTDIEEASSNPISDQFQPNFNTRPDQTDNVLNSTDLKLILTKIETIMQKLETMDKSLQEIEKIAKESK